MRRRTFCTLLASLGLAGCTGQPATDAAESTDREPSGAGPPTVRESTPEPPALTAEQTLRFGEWSPAYRDTWSWRVAGVRRALEVDVGGDADVADPIDPPAGSQWVMVRLQAKNISQTADWPVANPTVRHDRGLLASTDQFSYEDTALSPGELIAPGRDTSGVPYREVSSGGVADGALVVPVPAEIEPTSVRVGLPYQILTSSSSDRRHYPFKWVA